MEVGSLDGTGHSGYSPLLPDGANQSGQGFKDRSAARKKLSPLGRGQTDSIHPCLVFYFFWPPNLYLDRSLNVYHLCLHGELMGGEPTHRAMTHSLLPSK